jgi:hypothetical protein
MGLPHDTVSGTILAGLILTAILFFAVRALTGAG